MILAVSMLFLSLSLYLVGTPPFSDVAERYFLVLHSTARMSKVVHSITGATLVFVLGAADELGLFDVLEEKKRLSVAELAHSMDASTRGVDALVDYLCQAGFIESNGDGTYSNSILASSHLVSGLSMDQDLRPMLRVFSGADFCSMFSTTAAAVKKGGTQLAHHAETSSPWWTTFARHSLAVARATATDLIKGHKDAFGERVLDIGCGSGGYSLEIGLSFPLSILTMQDFENVLHVTRAHLSVISEANASRIRWLPGDFFEVRHFGLYDTILAANVVSNFGWNKSIEFFKHAARLACTGASILVIDHTSAPKAPYSMFEGRAPSRTFPLTMLVWSKDGKPYTLEEYKSLFVVGGWKFVRSSTIADFWLVVEGRKAG